MKAKILFEKMEHAGAHHRMHLASEWFMRGRMAHHDLHFAFEYLFKGERPAKDDAKNFPADPRWQCAVTVVYHGDKEAKWLRELPLGKKDTLEFIAEEVLPPKPPPPTVRLMPQVYRPRIPFPQRGQLWWQVLGVTWDAPLNKIDAAFKERAMQWHPDRGGNHEAMVLLNRAWDIAKYKHGQ